MNPTPLLRLHELLADDMVEVNRTILAKMQSDIPMIPKLAGYLIAAGGKRIRPLLNLACCRMLGYEGTAHISLATAVEFIHTATLIHDDEVYRSDQRRGKPSANYLFGNQASVLVGDFLFSRSFQLMVATDDLKVLDILSTAACTIAAGEVMQLGAEGDLGIVKEQYMEIISGKTAALFEAACETGALLSQADEQTRQALHTYGKLIGLTFQITDDLLDYIAQSDDIGKNTGDDFREGKVTLPVIIAYSKGDKIERAFWERTMHDQDIKDGDLEHAIDLMQKHSAIDEAFTVAEDFSNKAQNALDKVTLPQNDPQATEILKALRALAGFIVHRGH